MKKKLLCQVKQVFHHSPSCPPSPMSSDMGVSLSRNWRCTHLERGRTTFPFFRKLFFILFRLLLLPSLSLPSNPLFQALPRKMQNSWKSKDPNPWKKEERWKWIKKKKKRERWKWIKNEKPTKLGFGIPLSHVQCPTAHDTWHPPTLDWNCTPELRERWKYSKND